jgi:hypothetical protein
VNTSINVGGDGVNYGVNLGKTQIVACKCSDIASTSRDTGKLRSSANIINVVLLTRREPSDEAVPDFGTHQGDDGVFFLTTHVP